MSRPLDWPPGLRRTPPALRRRSGEWRHYIQVRDVIVRETQRITRGGEAFLSTDAPPDLVGTPVGRRRDVWDPGVVVYFKVAGHWHAHACDDFVDRMGNMGRVADRLAHGVRPIRLPWNTRIHRGRQRPRGRARYRRSAEHDAWMDAGMPTAWWRDLGLSHAPQSLAEAESAFRAQVKLHHPDRGGDSEKMRRAVEAVERARATMG